MWSPSASEAKIPAKCRWEVRIPPMRSGRQNVQVASVEVSAVAEFGTRLWAVDQHQVDVIHAERLQRSIDAIPSVRIGLGFGGELGGEKRSERGRPLARMPSPKESVDHAHQRKAAGFRELVADDIQAAGHADCARQRRVTHVTIDVS